MSVIGEEAMVVALAEIFPDIRLMSALRRGRGASGGLGGATELAYRRASAGRGARWRLVEGVAGGGVGAGGAGRPRESAIGAAGQAWRDVGQLGSGQLDRVRGPPKLREISN